jgi:hypothetical protein
MSLRLSLLIIKPLRLRAFVKRLLPRRHAGSQKNLGDAHIARVGLLHGVNEVTDMPQVLS